MGKDRDNIELYSETALSLNTLPAEEGRELRPQRKLKAAMYSAAKGGAAIIRFGKTRSEFSIYGISTALDFFATTTFSNEIKGA
jgi:hypothetical protein